MTTISSDELERWAEENGERLGRDVVDAHFFLLTIADGRREFTMELAEILENIRCSEVRFHFLMWKLVAGDLLKIIRLDGQTHWQILEVPPGWRPAGARRRRAMAVGAQQLESEGDTLRPEKTRP